MGRLIRIVVALAVTAAVATSTALALTRAHRSSRPACTWGASSIVATEHGGRWSVSAPATSGCAKLP